MPLSDLKNPVGSGFTIGFDGRDSARLHKIWEGILRSERWSEGPWTARFEELWSAWNELPSVAMSSWGGAALATMEFVDVRDQVVLCPSNTFMATPLSVLRAGGRVEFVDCNRMDLCMSFEDFVQKAERFKPKAAWLVHIGGHIAFETEKIADYCKQKGIWLLEDCAHAHGAEWNGRKPGSWGDAGVYSFYATKTVSTGEGGMLVSHHEALIEYACAYRNYGKPAYQVQGMNYRMSEFIAAIGCLQTERLPEIVAAKTEYARAVLDPEHSSRLKLPDGMRSGYYKYIVFDPVPVSTGKVYDQPCHRILGHRVDLPNTDWVAQNHWCLPIYYQGGRPHDSSG